jgi:transcriptional regulator GlxA family with amidase domain
MLEERLRAVRRVLRDGQPSGLTVTEAAASFRFYELGRFAGVYKKAFGEDPSDTLRSSGRSDSINTRKRTRRCLLEPET